MSSNPAERPHATETVSHEDRRMARGVLTALEKIEQKQADGEVLALWEVTFLGILGFAGASRALIKLLLQGARTISPTFRWAIREAFNTVPKG